MTGVSRGERAALRAKHYRVSDPWMEWCHECDSLTYPCTVTALLDALDEAEQRAQKVRALHAADANGRCCHCRFEWPGGLLAPNHPCPTLRALDGETPRP